MNALLKYPGAVFFRKARSRIETVNDLDGEVVNLFECIRLDPERLAHLVHWTPYSRQIYEQTYIECPRDPYERAAVFLTKCNMGYGYRTTGERVGWKNDVQGRERAYAAKDWTELPSRIMEVAERLRGVQIECQPAVEIIERYNHPNVLIYADPPYVLGTRNREQYRCEMSDRDHRDLLDVLLAHRGPVLLSGYDSELYRDALRGWHVEWKVSRTHALVQKQEGLWTNFEPQAQLNLLDAVQGGDAHEQTPLSGVPAAPTTSWL